MCGQRVHRKSDSKPYKLKSHDKTCALTLDYMLGLKVASKAKQCEVDFGCICRSALSRITLGCRVWGLVFLRVGFGVQRLGFRATGP